MRIVSPIDAPLRDEHVLDVDPPLRPELPGEWRRRINAFTGRALSDKALTAEQDARSGFQRLRGQSVTAGAINGLDLLFEPGAAGAKPQDARFQLLPGLGLTQWGEDVVVSTPRRIALADVPVYLRADHLAAITSGAAALPADPAAAPDPDATPGGIYAKLRARLPRAVGPALGAVLGKPAAAGLPRVAVLIAEPINTTLLGRPDPDDCPRDPRDDPYDDLELIDGARLTLFFWPSEMTALKGSSDYSLPPSGADFRNRLAYRVFNVERNALPGEFHPWERRGLPLALIAFKPDWSLDFVDRGAVVRLGGQPNPRTPLAPQSGQGLLWQARLAQFVEHYGELPDTSPAALAAAMRQLPPIGFLPRSVINLDARRQTFFPPGFQVSAAPIPVEHIDAAVRDSASLIPISLDQPDAVELLVPVPERVYEPGLLEVASVDPAFAQTLAANTADRTTWLIRRELVRRRRDMLVDAATGCRPSWPAADLPPAETLPYPSHRGPVTCTRVRAITAAGPGWTEHGFAGAASSFDVRPGDRVYVWVRIANPSADAGLMFNLTGVAPDGNACFCSIQWGNTTGVEGAGTAGGALPATDQWVRLDAPADPGWRGNHAPLGPQTGTVQVKSVMLFQQNAVAEWGPVGKISAAGDETIYLADDAPDGATVTPSPWPLQTTGATAAPVEADFGTVEAAGVRSVAAVSDFRARWPQAFLAPELALLGDSGLDGFIAELDAKLKATNDAIDLGFVRARADIYRVRTYMLGADAASRLVTSPTLADIAVREESARARSLDISNFLKSAYATDFQRDPTAPMDTRPPPTPAPPSAGHPPPATGGFTVPTPGVSGVRFYSNTLGFQSLATRAMATPASFAPAVTAAPIVVARAPAYTGPTTGGVYVPPPPPRAAGAASVSVTTAVRTASFEGVDMLSVAPAFSIAGLASGLHPTTPNYVDVRAQLPLPSRIERTTSVAERLVAAPAVEAHSYALEGKLAVVATLAGLMGQAQAGQARPPGIALGDLPTPGFKYSPAADPAAPRQKETVADLVAHAADYTNLDELAPSNARHEADYFNAAVQAIDNTIALMRLVEARIDLYQQVLDDARQVRSTVSGLIAAAEQRLRTIDVQVEEARHDVAVVSALLAEEVQRVQDLNDRRARILADHVKMIFFRRPRRAGARAALPTAPAAAALATSPLAACLRDHADAPEELRSFTAQLRDAPIAWFPGLAAQVRLIDRLDAARMALIAVQYRAASYALYAPPPVNSAPRFLTAVRAVMSAQQAVFDQRRLSAAAIDMGVLAGAGLAQLQRQIAGQASLGDLIAGDHSRPTLASLAAQEVQQLGQVAACLHASFSDTPPVIRLAWAETLSEFDQPAPLNQLAALARWSELPLELRRTQQGFVDWLFSRIDPSVPAAVAAINEVVRVCLLLAAHAPVDRIVASQLVAPARSEVGSRFDLAVDVSSVRIGMAALLRGDDGQPIAQGVIEDLSEGLARARIIQAYRPPGAIAAGARVELGGLLRGL